MVGVGTPFCGQIPPPLYYCRAVSGGSDKTVRVWDVASGRCTTVLQVGAPVVSVAWWSNDRFVVAGLDNGAIEVWDVERGQRVRELKGHTASVGNLDVSPDQTRLLSASADKTARLWKLDSGECVHILQGHTKYVNSAVLSRDGLRALSGSADTTVRLWDLATGRCVRVLEGHTEQANVVAWHPSNPSLAVSGSDDKTVRVWNVNSGTCLSVLKGHITVVEWYFHWSPDGHNLSSCDALGLVIMGRRRHSRGSHRRHHGPSAVHQCQSPPCGRQCIRQDGLVHTSCP